MNKVLLSGRLTRPIEIINKADYKYVANSLAVEIYKQKEKVTVFVDFIVYNQQAEYLSKYAKKGSIVETEGNLDQKKIWDDIKRMNYTSLRYNCEKIKIIADFKEIEIFNNPAYSSAVNTVHEHQKTDTQTTIANDMYFMNADIEISDELPFL